MLARPMNGYPASLTHPVYPHEEAGRVEIMVASHHNLSPALTLLVPSGWRLWVYYGLERFTYTLSRRISTPPAIHKVGDSCPPLMATPAVEVGIIKRLVAQMRAEMTSAGE